MNNNPYNWFVVKTLSRCEKKVEAQLLKLGYHAYVPLQKTVRIWSDRKKKVLLPLIPSVVFVENPEVEKVALYQTPHVHSILKYNGKVGIVKPQEIDYLRCLCQSDTNWKQIPLATYNQGETVEIIGGPFSGNIAKAIEEKNNYTVVLAIESLGIGFQVAMAKNNINKIS